MNAYFDSTFFAGNRQKLKQLFSGTAPIVLTANGLLQKTNDITYPFRQDSNFWYLTGIDQSDVVLVMDKDKEYLILPERSWVQDAFEGALDADTLSEISGISEVLEEKEGWRRLGGRLGRVQHVATLPALKTYVKEYSFYSSPARGVFLEKLRTHNPSLELLDIREHFIRMRMIKQEPELKILKDVISLTSRTLNALAKRDLTKFAYEYEIEAYISGAFRKKGALHGYEPIVATGKNACTLHYEINSAPVNAGDLLLIDTGAKFSNYSADITRTFPIGEVSRRQRAVYSAVLDVQRYAFSLLKPGLTLRSYEHEVSLYMGEKLRELGLIKLIEQDTVRHYFPTLTSHFLGLDIHDVGDYERPLEPGMVLTVEPGIYIPEESIGVRIEDDVLITDDGYENLSKDCLTQEWAS